MMQVFRKRLALASRPASPRSDSTSTIVGTTAGHSPAARSASSNASDDFVREENLERAPLSRTSTSASLIEASLPNPTSDRIGMGLQALGRVTHLGGKLLEVLSRGIECVTAFEFGAQCDLQQLRSRQAALLQLSVEIVRKVDLDAWHAPNNTHIWNRSTPDAGQTVSSSTRMGRASLIDSRMIRVAWAS